MTKRWPEGSGPIETLLGELAAGRCGDPHTAASNLAALIEQRDLDETARLTHAQALTDALHHALVSCDLLPTVDAIPQVVLRGAADITRTQRIMFGRLEHRRVHPLAATPATGRLPVPFDLAHVIDPHADLPSSFALGARTCFCVKMAGNASAIIIIDKTLEDDMVNAMILFSQAVGSALECAALAARRDRQGELLHALHLDGPERRHNNNPASPAAVDPPIARPTLTPREQEVLTHVLVGSANRVIAEQLSISVETVRSHVKRLLRKHGVSNRAELIARFDTPSAAD